MTKEDLWNLFKLTGKIEYYLEYKKRSGENEHRGSRGDSSL